MICSLFIGPIAFDFLILFSSNLDKDFQDWKTYLTRFLKVDLSDKLQQVEKRNGQGNIWEEREQQVLRVICLQMNFLQKVQM